MDKEAFETLFRNGGERFQQALYDLAGQVVKDVAAAARDRRDLHHDIYLHLHRQQRKCKSAATAWSYFYCVGQRYAWERAQRKGEDQLPEYVENGEQCEDASWRSSGDAVPLRTKVPDRQVPKSEVKTALRLLDSIIKKTKQSAAKLEPSTEAYGYVSAGISFLQQYRYSLVGSYYPMDLATVHYSKDAVRGKGTE